MIAMCLEVRVDGVLVGWLSPASVGRNPKGQDTAEWLGAEHEHAVPPVAAGDAQNPPEGTSDV